MGMKMEYPTNQHKEYIEYMTEECTKYGLSLLLEGSLARNLGSKYSDIDLAMSGDITTELIDKIISGYDLLIMSNYTEKPKGIFILNYKNGINVDLDIRETFLSNEIESNILLCNNGIVIDDILKRKEINSEMLPSRQQWYKVLRLIHRCCIKYLCNKEEYAIGLCAEVKQALYELYNINLIDGNILSQMREALKLITDKENVDNEIIELFDDLLIKCKRRDH
ncbi:hypothetical protein [Anaerocolumna sp. MB42-C2]|uniref:hypothetical protein n=1 Tax=Anaerocolumna sp. MB42-C2 TaxID=3070997 RepID=UPI0027E01BFF|nr:hypothetical protein [Anaerocolumna sp. MB42-C2]WMJ87423.1 hypothetical protein RBU59_25860 [Anaerocolumna sp. MB42-C2]